MQDKIRILQASFDLPIRPQEIGRWRGAFIEMGAFNEDLFHNHKGDNYHYRYPLVQYRMHKGKAALFAINEGVEALQRVLAENKWELNWKGESVPLRIEDLKMREVHLSMLETPRRYVVKDWLALNEKNYRLWAKAPGLVARVQLLEKLLANQLIALCNGMNYRMPSRLEVSIESISRTRKVPLYGIDRVAFDLDFRANIFLPSGLAFGKGVSHGFGRQFPFRKKLNDSPTPFARETSSSSEEEALTENQAG